VIAAAAPCDYRPVDVAEGKLRKTGARLQLALVETPDVVARLGDIRRGQWMVGFALETADRHIRALQKLERKRCDLIVANSPEAIHAADTSVEVLDPSGTVVGQFSGSKADVAERLLDLISRRLIDR
jgi:phosphopantothenoylcysteine decarboxylase/phosphopantothenate--cysteine ligase